MFIQTEPTPSPESVKFIPDTTFVIEGAADPRAVFDFTRAVPQAYAPSGFFGKPRAPLPARLFDLAGVARVMVAPHYVVVTKTPEADWAGLKTPILIALMDHLTAPEPAVYAVPEGGGGASVEGMPGGDPTLATHIRAVIDDYIRPDVAAHGGDIALSHVQDGVVYLHLRGACAGCPSLQVTLKKGVEHILKTHIPDIVAVEAVAA